jgi:hypothetical protein
MSKPFEPEEAKIAEEKTEKLVEILNSILKKYRAELGPQKDHDMAFICKGNPNIVIYVDVEAIPDERWKNIKDKYPTVRWPMAKKTKCEEKYLKRNLLAIMMSFDRDNLENIEMFYIDCETWIKEGKLETARVVRTRHRRYVYREQTPEQFWAIDKKRVIWGVQNLEEFLDRLLQRKGLKCS